MGCYPAGLFTTARTVPPGEIQHVAFLDVPFTTVEDQVPARSPATPAAVGMRERTLDYAGPYLGYGLRLGLHSRVEAGASIGLGTGELNTKLALVQNEELAISIAPRVATSLDLAGDFDQLLHARAPILFTFDLGGVSITPRIGVGFASGRTGLSGLGSGSDLHVNAPTAETGIALVVPIGAVLGIAAEAYGMRSLNDSMTNRTFITGGGGLAILFGGSVGRQRLSH